LMRRNRLIVELLPASPGTVQAILAVNPRA